MVSREIAERFYKQLTPREKRMMGLALKDYDNIPEEQRRSEMAELVRVTTLEIQQHPIRVWLRHRWRVLRNLMWPGIFSSDSEAGACWAFMKYLFTGDTKHLDDFTD
jgi:hypothetical protein